MLRSLAIAVACALNIHAGDLKSASIVVDGGTGNILFSDNESKTRYPASLTKKMTLYLIFEALKQGRITLQTRFYISERAAKQCPSKLGIPAGQSISTEDAIKSLIVKSANDVAVAVAEGLSGSVEKFAFEMTKKARQLNMGNTVFKNPSGVNDVCTTDKGQYTSAKDLSILAISLYRDFPEYAHYFKLKSFTYKGRTLANHNHMLGEVDGLDGIKTGFVNASGFNISTSALRYDKNNNPHRLFVVVMGGKSWRSRDRHAEQLIEKGFKQLGCPSSYDENKAPLSIIEDVKIKTVSSKRKNFSQKQKAILNLLDAQQPLKKINYKKKKNK